jgi:hypothetical protein
MSTTWTAEGKGLGDYAKLNGLHLSYEPLAADDRVRAGRTLS